MAKDKITTLVMRGKLQYAKILGEPGLNFNKDGNEWRFDFIPLDEKGAAKELKAVGVEDRLRSLVQKKTGEPKYDGAKFMTFKQNATKKDGSPNRPITVETATGTAWDHNTLLGNDTVADVKFVVIDNGPNRFTGVYPRSVRILKHEKYERSEFEALDEDDEFFEEAMEAAENAATPELPVDIEDEELDDLPIE